MKASWIKNILLPTVQASASVLAFNFKKARRDRPHAKFLMRKVEITEHPKIVLF